MTSFYVFDAGQGREPITDRDTTVAWLRARTDRTPLLRRQLRRVPADLDFPYWTEVDMDPADHVHFAYVGLTTRRDLHDRLAAVTDNPIDLSGPPWEIHVLAGIGGVEDLPEGATVVALRAHHSLTDGKGMLGVARTLFDDPGAEYSTNLVPTTIPGPVRAASAVPARLVRFFLAEKRAQRAQKSLALQAAEGTVIPPPSRPLTRFNRSDDGPRRFGRITLDLDEVRALARGTGTSVNDVMLAIVSGGLSTYLASLDETPAASLATQIPRALDDADSFGSENRVKTMVVDLHTDETDPAERLRRIHDSALREKTRSQLHETRVVDTALASCPAFLMARLFRRAARKSTTSADVVAPVMNTVMSNVARGPAETIHFGGSPAVMGFGAACLNRTTGLIHTATSLGNVIVLSFNSKEALMPDSAEYERALASSFRQLRDALRE